MAKQPEKIDKYDEVSLIARGGMGAVYKAMHPTLIRPVILKKLTLRGKTSFAERFKREARILMDFRHDDIVTVFDHFKEGSSYYIVMEYVDGTSLEGLLKEHRYLDSIISSYILLHSAKALGYAHRRGVIHRDIKPANILLSRDGAVKLADFGIASSVEDADSGLTSEGMTLGTPTYMAPEQFENSKYVDSRADIYALGVMAYEMSTGKRPFTGGFSPELISSKQKGRYVSPKKHIPGIAPQLLKIIRGSMRSNRKRRYANVDPVIKRARRILRPYDQSDIRNALGAMVRGEKDISLPKRRPTKSRRIIAAALIAAAVIVTAAGLYFSTLLQPLFLGSQSGRVRIEFEVPRNSKRLSLVKPDVSLFLDDANEIPEVDTPLLIPELLKSDDLSVSYSTLPLFLPAGGYRIKAVYGSDVYWSSFLLPSHRELKQTAGTGTLIKQVRLPAIESLPLSVDLSVHDAWSGRNIKDSSVLLVETSQGLIPVTAAAGLRSGRVWRFHLKAPGYLDQIYALAIDPRQARLFLDAELLPLPLKVKVDGMPESAEIRINGDNRTSIYIPVGADGTGNYTIAPRRLGVEDLSNLMLPPGSYRLEIDTGGRSANLDFKGIGGELINLQLQATEEILRLRRMR